MRTRKRTTLDDGFDTKRQAEFVTPKGGDMVLYADLLGTDRKDVIEIALPRKPQPNLTARATRTPRKD